MNNNRYFVLFLTCAAIVFSSSLMVSAQVGELRGHVIFTQPDGRAVPAAGVQIDVFRTDRLAQYNTKTDKKGEFVFAGLPYDGTYVVAASYPIAQPAFERDVKAGHDHDVNFQLTPGDGKRLTRADLRLEPQNEKVNAENEKIKEANKKIESDNQKIVALNAVFERAVTSGNEALNAKNYDRAIALYDEAISADPTHPAAPTLMINKSVALTRRGIAGFNGTLASSDQASKDAGMAAARSDFEAASIASAEALRRFREMPASGDPAAVKLGQTNLYAALASRAAAMRLFTKLDPTNLEDSETAYQEYLAVESDPAKRSKAEHDFAQMLFDIKAIDNSKTIYEQILEHSPADLDALKNMGLIYSELGAQQETDGETEEAAESYKTGSEYLQRYVDAAPAGQSKTEILGLLKSLKSKLNP